MSTALDQPEVNLDIAVEHGLTEEEYEWIVDELGRTPTIVELGIYSVMWSEHCSYKNSIALIKTLPRDGDQLLVGAGDENAGLVDIGDNLAVAFKIESHNHPSAVEPYQGAATGVGGIHRDIFTMGARPICALNSLRFGSPDDDRVRYLVDGVVRGIGDYGNAFGVPTVAGEVYFDEAYEGNPLVNAMSVGIVKHGENASAVAKQPGSKIYIVGAQTGRDGIHGATFASEEISEESEEKRPSVQVGDPFTEKLLLEATLEALKEDVAVGIQDMGAAGITCSSCEMSAKGESGMVLRADEVPMREPGMNPYEILLSESQERMLIVCRKGREQDLEDIFRKWDLEVAHIGEVTDTGRVQILWDGEEVASVRAEHLVLGGGAPVYQREAKKPEYLEETQSFDQSTVSDLTERNMGDAVYAMLESPNIASRSWIFEQYDTTVRTNTVIGPGPSDAAVIRLKDGGKKGLAVKTDGNGRYVHLNPRRGGQIAVAESARNVACAGGQPMAITNCLNYGNPYKPEVYWTFKESVSGIGDACRALNTPVTGGNVSLYNEHPEGAVYPTPTIGMLGLVEDVESDATNAVLKEVGDYVYMLTPQGWKYDDSIGGSEYLGYMHEIISGDAPHLDLDEEQAVQKAILSLIRGGVVKSAHDVSDGGLITCLAEQVIFSDERGLDITINPPHDYRLDAVLFGEAQSRIIFTANKAKAGMIEQKLSALEVSCEQIGRVTSSGDLQLKIGDDTQARLDGIIMRQRHQEALPRMLNEA